MTAKFSFNWVKTAISFGLPIFLLLLPCGEVYTQPIKIFLAITLWTILCVAFELFPVMVPGILMIILYCVTGVAPANIAFSCWTATTAYVLVGAFVLANVLNEVGLLRRIAYWCIIKTGGSFTGICWGVYLATVLMAMMTFVNAFVVAAAFVYGLCVALKLPLKSREGGLLMMIGTVGSVGCRSFYYAPAASALVTAGAQQVVPDFGFTWLEYTYQNLPNLLYAVALIWLLTKIYKSKKVTTIGTLDEFKQTYRDMGPLTLKEKKAAVVLVVLLAFLLTNPIHHIPTDYGFMVLPFLFFMPGIKVGSEKAIRDIDIGMLFFVVSCLGIGTVGNYLGLGTIISGYAAPLLAPLGETAAMVGIVGVCFVLNFLMTPFAIMASMSTPIAQIAADIGVNPLACMYTLVQSTDYIILPYEFVPHLIFFSFGFWSMKDFVVMNLIKCGTYLLFFILMLLPYWRLVGVL